MPLLVVTNITPLPARAPYIEAAPSLSTDIDSIWLASIVLRSICTPSTITNGPPNPRMLRAEASEPGMPDDCTALMPGRRPASVLLVLLTGATVISDPFTVATDPVSVAFF